MHLALDRVEVSRARIRGGQLGGLPAAAAEVMSARHVKRRNSLVQGIAQGQAALLQVVGNFLESAIDRNDLAIPIINFPLEINQLDIRGTGVDRQWGGESLVSVSVSSTPPCA